jgi:hypothetical protein
VVFSKRPGVAELADAADSKSAGALLCVGSTPSSGTNPFQLIRKMTPRAPRGYVKFKERCVGERRRKF